MLQNFLLFQKLTAQLCSLCCSLSVQAFVQSIALFLPLSTNQLQIQVPSFFKKKIILSKFLLSPLVSSNTAICRLSTTPICTPSFRLTRTSWAGSHFYKIKFLHMLTLQKAQNKAHLLTEVTFQAKKSLLSFLTPPPSFQNSSLSPLYNFYYMLLILF